MLAGVARLEMHRIIILIRIMMRGGLWMLVCGGTVLVLWVIVRRVGMGVQRGDLGHNAYEGEADHEGEDALHSASVWKHRAAVKRQVFWRTRMSRDTRARSTISFSNSC